MKVAIMASNEKKPAPVNSSVHHKRNKCAGRKAPSSILMARPIKEIPETKHVIQAVSYIKMLEAILIEE